MGFQVWVEEKKVKESDLVFTKSLKTPTQTAIWQKTADQMAALRPSFTEGLLFLELALDLILMGHDEDLFTNQSDFNSWHGYLKKLRYPETHNRDLQLKEKLETLPWPAASKIKFERRGDRSGVELKTFISSETDLVKLIASLERVKSEFKS